MTSISLEKAKKNQAKRKKIIEEIVETERSYVEGLNFLDKLYIQPLIFYSKNKEDSSYIIDKKICDYLFDSILTICKINQNIWNQLKQEGCSVPKIFKSIAPVLKLYAGFINNFENIERKIDKITAENAKFDTFIKTTDQSSTLRGFTDFSSLFITPVQRIPRYRLLFKELLSTTPQDHKEYYDVKAAFNLITVVASSINETAKKFQKREKLISLWKEISGWPQNFQFIVPNRYFVKEIQRVKFYNFSGQFIACKLYLFNNLILVISKSGKIFLDHIFLNTLPVTKIYDNKKISMIDYVANDTTVVEIENGKNSVIIKAAGIKEKEIIIKEVCMNIANLFTSNSVQLRTEQAKIKITNPANQYDYVACVLEDYCVPEIDMEKGEQIYVIYSNEQDSTCEVVHTKSRKRSNGNTTVNIQRKYLRRLTDNETLSSDYVNDDEKCALLKQLAKLSIKYHKKKRKITINKPVVVKPVVVPGISKSQLFREDSRKRDLNKILKIPESSSKKELLPQRTKLKRMSYDVFNASSGGSGGDGNSGGDDSSSSEDPVVSLKKLEKGASDLERMQIFKRIPGIPQQGKKITKQPLKKSPRRKNKYGRSVMYPIRGQKKIKEKTARKPNQYRRLRGATVVLNKAVQPKKETMEKKMKDILPPRRRRGRITVIRHPSDN